MQYLEGDPKELWYAHFERSFEACERTPTWEYYKQYLLDLLADPVNRSLEAATAHSQALQRKDQTVRSFATYLEVLEDQLTPYTEVQRVQHLFTKLRPEL
jgi:two-component sensor histidine kinase